MNLFLLGTNKDNLGEISEEIKYSNIFSLVISFAAFVIFLVLLKGYGWITPVYIALSMVAIINFTLVLNYWGFTLSSRLFLSLLPPAVILAGDILTLVIIPDGTHTFSFDVRVLMLALLVIPLLLFPLSERVCLTISLVFNGIILLFFDYIHLLLGVRFSNAFGPHYYISTIFYAIAFLFIITIMLIFKVRWCKLKKVNKKILSELEEKVLLRTHELEQSTKELIKHNNELEQFSYTISHNLRGPVARLMGLANLFDLVDNAEKHTIINQLRLTTKSLDEVISDLNKILDIRNNLYHVKEYIDISEEIKLAQQLLSNSSQEIYCLKNIELNIKENKVFGVKAFIQSIIYNLIGNAYKYKRNDVDLKLKISTELKGSNFLLKIADNGRGIDLDKYGKKIFKMYSRFDLEMQGKGLGLYLVKQQVESMNGLIQIKSKVNQGSTFSIVLPVPDSSKIRDQVYFENDVVIFTYNAILNSSVVSWKRNPSSEEYRNYFSINIKNLSKYSTDFWIQDTFNLRALPQADQEWFNEEIFPLLLNSGIKGIVIINKEGKGFDSPRWTLFKKTCSTKGIVLAFKHDLDEAYTFINSFKNHLKNGEKITTEQHPIAPKALETG